MDIDLSVPIWTVEHVAAALGNLSVDAAREYTYTAKFPAAKDGFARNLWLRDEVLAWFAGLPAKPRRGTGADDGARLRKRTSATGASGRRAGTRSAVPGPDAAQRHPPCEGLPATSGA